MNLKKSVLILSIFSLVASLGAGYAEDVEKAPEPASDQVIWNPAYPEKKKLKDAMFVVSTDERSAAESLERISGDYDIGFSLPTQSYKSSSHYVPASPFVRENPSSNPSDSSYQA